MTRGFRKILAVCDDSVGSDEVLNCAIAVARTNGAHLTVVKSLVGHPGSSAAVEETRKHLSRIVPWIIQEGVEDVSVDVLVGPTDIEVCRYVVRRRHDLVITGAEVGRRRMSVLRGNPAASLMRRCPCSVWIIKEGQTSENSILAAVDATADRPIDPLDLAILDTAVTLAKAQNAWLHVVHAWEMSENESDLLKSDCRDSFKHAVLDRCETKHREALERLLDRYRGSRLRVKRHVPRGDPPTEIARVARKIGAGLVVMGSTCRVGLLGLVMGGSAGSVLSEAPCSVLAVKSGHVRTADTILKVERQAKLISSFET